MKLQMCSYCCSVNSLFPIHGCLVCAHCKSAYPEDEPDDQDLFDLDLDEKPSYEELIFDLVLMV